MPEKKTVYIIMRVEVEHPIPDLAKKVAAKVQTTQGVALAEAAEVVGLYDEQDLAIDKANSFAPLNEDGSVAQAPD